MSRLFMTAMLSTLATAAFAAAELNPGQFTGTYDWTDKKPNDYGDNRLALVVKKADEGYQCDFQAHFFFKKNGKAAKGRNFSYSGILKPDTEKGGFAGKVYDEKKKRFWLVTMKPSKEGFTGTAKETKGYKSSGTFAVAPKKK